MRIYFTRHGETEWNRDDRICGVTDLSLTEVGYEQAEKLALEVPDTVQHIICSPMKRARQTAVPVSRRLDIVPTIDRRLTEWNYGTFEGLDRNTEGFHEAKLEFGVRMPQGESAFDVAARLYPLLRHIPKRYKDDVLIITHGGICRMIELFARGMTREQFGSFYMDNCQILSYDPADIPAE
ncbi:MAG: histidine phosphatase family protein [Oscillospiraceae bacterium]|nr:histidine phosphatase family protein [Oscillospiraceae bacterium]